MSFLSFSTIFFIFQEHFHPVSILTDSSFAGSAETICSICWVFTTEWGTKAPSMGSGREKWWKDKRGNKLINDTKIIFPNMKKLARPRNELFRLLCKNILEVINNLRRMLSLEKYDTSGKNANNEYILNFRINIIAFENSFHWALPM